MGFRGLVGRKKEADDRVGEEHSIGPREGKTLADPLQRADPGKVAAGGKAEEKELFLLAPCYTDSFLNLGDGLWISGVLPHPIGGDVGVIAQRKDGFCGQYALV